MAPFPLGTLSEQLVPKKKEKQMRTEIGSISIAQATEPKDEGRQHLMDRLRQISYEHNDVLWDKYIGEESPSTIGEAKEWIKKDLFRIDIDKHVKDDTPFGSWHYKFHWGKKLPDREAYDEAKEKMIKAWDAAKDIIMVKTDEDVRLKALKDFQAWKE